MKKKLVGAIVLIMLVFSLHAIADGEIKNEENSMTVREESVSGNDINEQLEVEQVKKYDNVEEQPKNKYSIYCNKVQAQLRDEQLKYLSVLLDEYKEKYEIENAKLELGYSTENKLTEAEAQVKVVELQIESVYAERDFYQECISIYGAEQEEVVINEQLLPLEKDYVSEFLAENEQVDEYNQQIQEYYNDISELSYEEDRERIDKIKDNISEIENYREQYVAELKIYVNEKILNYENALRKVSELEYQMTVMESNIATQKTLYENGKIAEIEVTELETQLEYLKFQRINEIYNANLILYILDNKIEN